MQETYIESFEVTDEYSFYNLSDHYGLVIKFDLY